MLQPSRSSLPESWIRILLILLLIMLTLALFWPATRYGFVDFDDDRYVSANPVVQQGVTVSGVRWAFTTVYESWWLPLLWLSYMADVELFGTAPFGFHFTNILLHAANAALLFWFLVRMTGAPWRSFFAAALFALHPLRVESVAWITERKDVLSGLFFMLALLAYVRQVAQPSRTRFWILHGLVLLGLMAKSILIILPVLLLLLDYWPLKRAHLLWGAGAWPQWRPLLVEKRLLFGLAAVFTALTLLTHGTVSENTPVTSLGHRLGLVGPNYWQYLAQVIWPARLSLLHPPAEYSRLAGLLAPLSLLAITGLLIRTRHKKPYLLVGWMWFLLALFPVIRGVRFDEQSAFSDRYTYLPGIGLALLVCWEAAAWTAGRRGRILAAGMLGCAALLACGWSTAVRLPDWRDSLTMFSRLIQFAPADPHVNNSYGFELLKQGRIEESLPYFRQAAALRPKTSPAVLNLANALGRLGRFDEMLAWLHTARARGFPDLDEIKALTGSALLGADRPAEALPFLRESIRWKPADPAWRVELVRALYESGQPEAALEEIRRLREMGIHHIRDFDSLAEHYAGSWRLGNAEHAWYFFRNNLRHQPDHIALLNNAAWLLATMDSPPAPPAVALEYARHAASLTANADPAILDTLAAALAATGGFAEARQTANRASALARSQGLEALAGQIEIRAAAYARLQPWRAPPLRPPQSPRPAGWLSRLILTGAGEEPAGRLPNPP